MSEVTCTEIFYDLVENSLIQPSPFDQCHLKYLLPNSKLEPHASHYTYDTYGNFLHHQLKLGLSRDIADICVYCWNIARRDSFTKL